jgi:hypothetical protein
MRVAAARQWMTAWAEDRARLRSLPSTDPGTKTGAGAGRNGSALLLGLRQWMRAAPGLAQKRPTFAARRREIQTGWFVPSLAPSRREFQFTVNQHSRRDPSAP